MIAHSVYLDFAACTLPINLQTAICNSWGGGGGILAAAPIGVNCVDKH